MVKIAFYTITGQTQDFMMDSVVDFLTYKDNKENLLGLIGCGNRNFNDLFAQTAKKISVTLHVPILYLLELSGNSADVKNVRQIVKEACKEEHGTQKDLPIQNPSLSNINFLRDFRQKNE